MDVEIIDPVEYGQVGRRALLAVLYRPYPAEKPLPALVWIHGGAWLHGSRHDNGDMCQAIARAGFVCLSIDYRLSSEAIFPAAIEDCKCAVRYLRAHAEHLSIVPDKIGAWGPSAGGHLAALLGTSGGVDELEGDGGWGDQDSRVQAVCDWFGPTDFAQMSRFASDVDHDAPDSPESLLIGGPVQQHPERTRQTNPITYVSAATPPLLIAHGRQDRIVPFNQSELLHAALVAQERPVIFEVLDNAGHGGAGFEADGPLAKRCIAFMQQHLA